MSKVSKRFKAAVGQFDRLKEYDLAAAVKLVKTLAPVKFDASVEVHLKLNIDVKQSNQSVRSIIILPQGLGKERKILALAQGEKAQEAKAAGASTVGGEEIIKDIKDKKTAPYDVVVTEPTMMKKLAPIAKILGQRGLMPNPKTDTIGVNIKKLIADLRAGKIVIKNDDAGNLHQMIGKVSWPEEKILANLKAYLEAVKKAKPQGVKTALIATATICSTMGPGIKLIV